MQSIDPILVGYKDIYDGELIDETLIALQKNYTTYIDSLPIALPYVRQASFCYLNDFSINALANVIDDCSVVAMTVYAPVIFSDLFYGILSHPSVLRDFEKDAEVGQFDRYFIPKQIEELSDLNTYAVRSPRWRPEALVRNSYAAMLTNVALDFLFLHEVGHLFHGHPHMRREMLRCFDPLTAFGDVKEIESVCLINHALEYDADWFAIKYLIDFGFRNKLISSKLAGLSETPRFLFKTIVLAVLLVMFSGDLSRYKAETYKRRTHPHPYWRFLTLYSTGAETVETLYPELISDWKAAFNEAIIELRYISGIYEPAQRFFSDASSMKVDFGGHFERIVAEHSTVTAILQKSPHHFLSYVKSDP